MSMPPPPGPATLAMRSAISGDHSKTFDISFHRFDMEDIATAIYDGTEAMSRAILNTEANSNKDGVSVAWARSLAEIYPSHHVSREDILAQLYRQETMAGVVLCYNTLKKDLKEHYYVDFWGGKWICA